MTEAIHFGNDVLPSVALLCGLDAFRRNSWMLSIGITARIHRNTHFYFRDAYNLTNLAWVKGLSYWQAGKIKRKHIEFFEHLAAITDEDIDDYVRTRVREAVRKGEAEDGEKEWAAMLKKKRNDVKAHLKFIRNARRVSWSV